jgi:shikimate 5-dehydrogenase
VRLALSALRKDAVLADVTYGKTPLVTEAFDGSDVLLFQAARAFHTWTGRRALRA